MRRVARQLGERDLERDPHLKRGLPVAPLVEIEPGAQRELLGDRGDLAPGQERGEASLGGGHARAPAPGAGIDQLPGVGPQAVGHLLPGAVAEARDQRVLAADAARGGSALAIR